MAVFGLLTLVLLGLSGLILLALRLTQDFLDRLPSWLKSLERAHKAVHNYREIKHKWSATSPNESEPEPE
ncbi:hypothetical protein CLM62_20300 [Streptomyces sp. SA15]|nr:hypothetical protein CLM62_20300 [Streptomyces sp. SA15]